MIDIREKKTKNRHRRKQKVDFFTEFAAETDIFTNEQLYPDWIFDFRENLLTKLSPSMKKVCRNLKGLNIEFKIKYPIKIFDKWKFADIYIPRKNTVILVLSSHKEFCKPCNSTPERSSFFKDKFRVVELYEYNASNIEVLKQSLKLQ